MDTRSADENLPSRAKPDITTEHEPGIPDAAVVRSVGGRTDAPRIAGEVLDALAVHAPALIEANARGRLFSECGPMLLRTFDEYRRRAGPQASVRVFHDALRERWMIELVPAG